MTGGERDLIQELRDEWSAFRDEAREQREEDKADRAQLLGDLAPAIRLAENLSIAGRAFAASGRFIKYGAGIGASIVTIVGGLKVIGVIP